MTWNVEFWIFKSFFHSWKTTQNNKTSTYYLLFLKVLFGLCLCTVKCFNLAEEMVSNPNAEENFQNSASNSNSETAEQEQQFELETYRKYILQLSEALKSCYDQNTVSSHPLSIVLSKNAQKSKFFLNYFHNNSNISIFSKFIEKYRYILI